MPGLPAFGYSGSPTPSPAAVADGRVEGGSVEGGRVVGGSVEGGSVAGGRVEGGSVVGACSNAVAPPAVTAGDEPEQPANTTPTSSHLVSTPQRAVLLTVCACFVMI